MHYLYAVESAAELSAYQSYAASVSEKLARYIRFLRDEYAAEELPETIVWTSRRAATKWLSKIPVPAYTNDCRIVFSPDLHAWRDIYLAQLDGLSGADAEKVRDYYNTALTDRHILQILGHELAHHSAYFPDSDYESNIWFEEGMAEYISRRYFLTDAEFEAEADINRTLVRLLMPVYGDRPLEEFGAETYAGSYAGIFFMYWRSFLAVQEIVDACGGDARLALRHHIWH